MDRLFEARLIECLSALEASEPMEQILARYPEDAERLRPILQIAAELPGLAMEPRLKAQQASRQRLLDTAQTLTSPKQRKARPSQWRPPVLEILGVAIISLSVTALLFAISASALPGTPLHGVKRTVEEVRLVLTTQDSARSALQQQFNQERIDETRILLVRGTQSEVEFEGVITSIQSNAWRVAELDVTISSTTQIIGNPHVGLTAQVQGRVAGGSLLAYQIIIGSGSGPQATDEPASTPIVRLTPTPSPTLAPSLTPTHLPMATPMLATPSLATPDEEDDTNDNQNDGDDHDDGNNNGNDNEEEEDDDNDD